MSAAVRVLGNGINAHVSRRALPPPSVAVSPFVFRADATDSTPGVDLPGGGHFRCMPELPEKKLSIGPPRSLLLTALALVVLVAVWFAVSAAVGWGGDDRPTKPETGAAPDNCS